MLWWTAIALAMTPAEQNADVEMVRDLVRQHPECDDPAIAQRMEEALAAIVTDDDQSPHQFHGRLLGALALLQDGHTDAVMDGPQVDAFFGEERFLPYDVVVFEDDLFLDPRFHEPARVVSIDGRTGRQIVAELRRHVTGDSSMPATRDGNIDRYFARNYAHVWGLADGYDVVLAPGPAEAVRVPGVSYADVPYVGDPGPNAVHLDDGLLSITLNEPMPGNGWRGFWRSLKAGLKTADAVVLDLRDCGGGFGPTEAEIVELFADAPVSYRVHRRIGTTFATGQPEASPYRIIYGPDESGVWATQPRMVEGIETVQIEPWRHAWTDRLVVVTGPETFSACSNVAAALTAHGGDVVVVGAETRGGARRLTAGQFEQRVLPNSGVLMQIPIVQFTAPAAFGEIGRGVVPDRPVSDRPDTKEDEVAACARRLAVGEECDVSPRPAWLSEE